MNNNDDSNLLQEALLDLAIIIKQNNELRHENNELKRRMEERENGIKRYGHKKGNNY